MCRDSRLKIYVNMEEKLESRFANVWYGKVVRARDKKGRTTFLECESGSGHVCISKHNAVRPTAVGMAHYLSRGIKA